MGYLKPNETVILLAEDEPLVRNLVRTMLTQVGYTVITAKDGAEALEICEAYDDEIQLFLSDVEMPRVDGLTAAAAVREMRPEVKVVIMSGKTIETIHTGNKPDAFLRKPFIPLNLVKCIETVLASPPPVECES